MNSRPWRAVIVGLPNAPPRVHVESGPGNTWTVTAVSGGPRPAGESADDFTKRIEAFLRDKAEELRHATGGYCPDDRYHPLFRVLHHYKGSELVWADFESKPGVVY